MVYLWRASNKWRVFIFMVAALAALLHCLAASNFAGQNSGTPGGEQTQGSAAPSRRPDYAGSGPEGQQAARSEPATATGRRIGGVPTGQLARPSTQSPSAFNSIFDPQTVQGAAKTSAPVDALGLERAIQIAIENNLATLLARERRKEAAGLKQELLAELMPNVSAAVYQASITQNLAALGFGPGTFPGFTSTFIGPFNNFDARARLVQSIFNLSAIRNFQAGRSEERVAKFDEELAREQVASSTALFYLEALRTDRKVSAARANLELAQALLKLAQDQRDAGVATGIDVTRAQTQVAQEQFRLAQAETASEQAMLNLQRLIGLPQGSRLTLTDQLRFATEALPDIGTAVSQAADNRSEVRIAEAQVRTSDLERRAVRAEFLPSLEFVGDYGVSGITPNNTALPTRRVAVQLDVPVFNGGLTRGRLTVATSRQRQAELQLGSVRGQVEEDVRLAFSALRTTAEQVRAADETVNLARRELEMARDRFGAGVADNLEVISAQTSLANARDMQVTALAQYNAARLNLAAALGHAETFRW